MDLDFNVLIRDSKGERIVKYMDIEKKYELTSAECSEIRNGIGLSKNGRFIMRVDENSTNNE